MKLSRKNSQELINLQRLSLAILLAYGSQVQAQELSVVMAESTKIKPAQQVQVSGRAGNESASLRLGTALNDVPLTLDILDAEQMQAQAAQSLDATIKNISGLSQSSTNNYGYFNNYLARGLPVGFLRDGLPDGPAINGYARTVNDVAQIEVLKGPGSALYGSGAPGGFVNLISKPASPNVAQNVEFGVGSFQERHLKFDATGNFESQGVDEARSQSASPLYRLAMAYQDTAGYRGFGNRSVEFVPSIVLNVDARQMTALEFRHLDSHIQNDSVGIPFRNGQILNVPPEFRYYTPFSSSVSKIDRLTLKHRTQINEAWQVQANLAHGRRDLDFSRNIPSWRLDNLISGKQMVNRNWRDQEDRFNDSAAQLEAIWRTSSGLSFHEILFGASWNRSAGTAFRRQALLAPLTDIFVPTFPERSNAEVDRAFAWNRKVRNQQSGLYMQDQMAVSPDWKVRAGLRYDKYQIEDRGFYNSLFDAGGAFTSVLNTNKQSFQSKPVVLKYENAKSESDQWSPSIGLVYQASSTVSLYGGVAYGSFSNFTTEIGRTAFAPETSSQIELGMKSMMLDGRFQANIAIYDTRRNDFFQTANGLAGNLGSSTTSGVDAEFVLRPERGWKLHFVYAYQDAVHTKYLNVVTKENDANVVGKQVRGAAKNQWNLWSSYDFQSPEWRHIGVALGANYRGAFYADLLNSNRAPNKVVFDAAVYYRQKHYEVQVNLSNLSNARWYRYAPAEGSAAPGDPRAINVVARFLF